MSTSNNSGYMRHRIVVPIKHSSHITQARGVHRREITMTSARESMSKKSMKIFLACPLGLG